MGNSQDKAAFRLFEQVMDLQSSQRQTILEKTRAEDPAKHAAVMAMLKAAEASDTRLEEGVGRGIHAVFSQQPRPVQVGDFIGAYRLERLLGRGGMGEVYLADRTEDVSMKAAVKLALDGTGKRALHKRFKRERDILASLKHPNIAQLLDAGTTEDNRPYFIMEYVEGQPIGDYCRDHKLTLQQRLGLFRRVCEAVSYAHRNLIIHRDIKPANILVTPEGEPKLLDFGISGLMKPGTTAAKTQTVLGLTPGYASPEQLDNHRLTAASDIYSLGVLLYVLLTGKLPIPVDDISPMAFFRQVREHNIARPSALFTQDHQQFAATLSTTPSVLHRQLQGDLDTILLHALAKRPEDRFSSVEAFSAELGRYLDLRPIRVRTPSLGYRAFKFVQRNKWPMVGGSLVLVVLVGFSLALFHQRSEVIRERDTSEQVVAFLAQTFQGADPNSARGATISAEELLDRGAARINVQLDHQPLVRANLMSIMGTAYRNLGEFAKAEPLLKEALAQNQLLRGPHHPDTLASLDELGLLYKDQSRYDLAAPLLRQALAEQRKLDDPSALLSSLNSLSLLLSAQGEKTEAELLLREAYQLRDQVSATYLAATVNNLGLLLKENGDLTEAEPYLVQALGLHRQLYPSPHPAIATSLNNLGLVAKEKGDLKAAEAHWQAALAMRRELYKPNHPKIMTSLNNLGAVLKDKGDLVAAERLFREVLDLKRQQFKPGHPKLIISLNNLANLLVEKGDLQQADPLFDEAVAIAEQKLPANHLFRHVLSRNRALLCLAQGRTEQSYELAKQAVEGLAQTQKADSLHLILAKGILGGALLAKGNYEEAEPLLLENHHYLAAADRDFPAHTTRVRQWLAQLYERTGQPQKALEYQAVNPVDPLR